MEEPNREGDEVVNSKASQIAELYGISVFKAREIMDICGSDANCIQQRAEKFHLENPTV